MKISRKKLVFLYVLLTVFFVFHPYGALAQSVPPAPTIPTQPLPSAPTTPTPTPTAPPAGSAPAAGTQTPDFLSCSITSGFTTCSIAAVTWVVKTLLGYLVSFGSVLVNYVLILNVTLMSSPIVQTGFSIILSIANLGFVLGIIVIALATILRSETYGIKQLLWKLVLMAILVNFGLVIAGPIVGFADNLTLYFMNATAGSGQQSFGDTMIAALQAQKDINPLAGQPANSGPGAYAPTSLTNCVNAGVNIQGLNTGTATGKLLWSGFNTLECIGGWLSGASYNTAGTSGDKWTIDIVNLFFNALFLGIIAFTLIALAILMLIRYLWLSFLLILMPLAWLLYIFPSSSHNFTKWWGLFIRWTFFPAISMFFIYLAMLISPAAQGSGTNATYLATLGSSGSSSNPLFQLGTVILSQIVLCGLTLGGLYAAQSLSITGADTAIGAGKWVGGQIRGFAGKHTKRVARRAYQEVGGNEINKALQRSRIPLVSTIGRVAGDWTKKGGSDLVKEESTNLKLSGRTDDELVDQLHGAGNILGVPAQFAYVQELAKRNKLDKIDGVGGKNFRTWFDEHEKLFTNYDQGKLKGDINKFMTSDKPMRQIATTMSNETAGVEIMDTNGMTATPGANVTLATLSNSARLVAEKTQAVIDDKGNDEIIKHNGVDLRAEDLLKRAEATIKQVDDIRGNVMIKDTEGTLGEAGKMVRAGNLMNAAADKFVEKMEKGDMPKTHPDYMFSGKGGFGIDAESAKIMGKAIAHGMAFEHPEFLGSMAGRINKQKDWSAFLREFKRNVYEAVAAGRMTKKEGDDLLDRHLTKVLANRIEHEARSEHSAPAAAPSAPSSGGDKH